MAKLPQGIIEMTKWPNTPTQARLKRALGLHQKAVQATDDGVMILTVSTDGLSRSETKKAMTAVMDTPEAQTITTEGPWQEWATSTFLEEMAQGEDTFERRIELIVSIIKTADTQNTMGLAIIADQTHESPKPGKTQIGMARMLRSSNWMGFCTLLKNLEGLGSIVVQSRDTPARIGHIFCMPMRYLTKDGDQPQADDTFQIEGGTELLKILRWHGIRRVYWNPVPEPDVPNQSSSNPHTHHTKENPQ